jgi:hypothetical protein
MHERPVVTFRPGPDLLLMLKKAASAAHRSTNREIVHRLMQTFAKEKASA